MSIEIIPHFDREAILEKLANLPNKDWLLADCQTADQQTHWQDCKLYFGWLRLLLKDYFSGYSTDFLDSMSLNDKQFWICHRDKYIYLYDILQYCWNSIKETMVKNQLGIPADSPGQMLVLVLEWEAAGMFFHCAEYASPDFGRFSPRKAYNFYQKSFKWKSPEEAIANLPKEALWFGAYKNFCLWVAEKESRKDSLLRTKLKNYKKLIATYRSELYQEVHPRKKVHGHQWVNGEKLPLA